MRHYGIPAKFVNIIKILCTDFSAQVICSNSLTDTFEIKTGVKLSVYAEHGLDRLKSRKCRQERD